MSRSHHVRGYLLPSPRPTRWALVYALLYFGLPLILVLLAFDVLLYMLFKHVFGWCYGITCLFG